MTCFSVSSTVAPGHAAATIIVRMVIAGSSPRPRRRNDSVPATTATIIRNTTSEGRFSPHSERFGPITAWSRAGGPSGRSAARGRRRSRRRRPGRGPYETSTRVGSDERISIARDATIPVFGSTTHTEACRSERVTADGGISMAAVAAAGRLMRPVTVVPRRIAAGGSIRRILTRNVPVTGSARGATSRTTPFAVTFGSAVSATTMSGFAVTASLTRAGTSRTASRAPSRATWTIMRPAPTTSPGSAPCTVTTPATLGHQPGVAQPVRGERDLRLRRFDLRLGGLEARLGLVERRTRHRVLDHQVAHPREVVLRLDEPGLRSGQLRARGQQAALLVLRVEPRDELARPHGVADADRPFQQAAVDPERLVDFGLRLHRAGQGERAAACALGDGHARGRGEFPARPAPRPAGRTTAAWPRRRRGRRPWQAGDGGARDDFARRRDSEARGSSQWTIPHSL